MSIKLMSLVWDSPLPMTEKFVALALADFADDEGNRIYPSVKTLAVKVGKSERAIQYNLRRLISRGILEAVSGENGGRGNTVHYRMHADRLASPVEDRKGDKVAPFTEAVEGERVQLSTQRVQPASPDPLRTIRSGSGSEVEAIAGGDPLHPRESKRNIVLGSRAPRSRLDIPSLNSTRPRRVRSRL